jgi:DNA-binding transcriptional MerR regulator
VLKILYSEEEICGMYKKADVNLNRIKLLQELTLFSKEKIVKILQNHGCELEAPVKPDNKPKKTLTKDKFMEYYKQNLSDYKISLKVGLSEGTIRYWRNKYGLPPNCRKKGITK